MPFSYLRTVHFADTDAAGVVFFANYLAMCHEAYEEALGAAGLDLNAFFSAHALVIPVAKSETTYLRPLGAGDKVRIVVAPAALTPESFALNFEIVRLGPSEKVAAKARTEHVCIDAKSRQRKALPSDLAAWIALS